MPLFAGPEAGTLLSTPPHSASARRRVAFWVSFGIAAAIAAIAGILTWQLIDAVAISNAVTTSPSGIAAGSGSPEASSPVAPEPKATEVIAAIENPTVEPVVAATEDANAGQYPPDDLNPPSYEATAEPTIDPTEEADLPYEIADPIDNLTATPTPGPYPEEGENPDLPT